MQKIGGQDQRETEKSNDMDEEIKKVDPEEIGTEGEMDGAMEEVQAAPEGEMVEADAPAPSARQRHTSRMLEKYPDLDVEDEEALWGAVGDDYDNYEKEIGRYRDNSQKLNDLFENDPRSASLVAEMARGGDPVLGLVRRYGIEIRDIVDDPAMQEEVAQANKEYLESVAKNKELEEEYRQNLDATLSTLEEIQAETGASDEDIDNAMEFLVAAAMDGVMGKFSRESIEMAMKAVGYDQAVADAAEEGEIAGRNAKIVERLRARDEGDGTQPLADGGATSMRRRGASIFDQARAAR